MIPRSSTASILSAHLDALAVFMLLWAPLSDVDAPASKLPVTSSETPSVASHAPYFPRSPWDVAGIDDPERFRLWYRGVQDWVRADDAAALADVVDFPLTVTPTRAGFIQRYRAIFTDEVKRAVIETDEDDLGLNHHGVMVARGVVWFRQTGHRGYVIGAINTPSVGTTALCRNLSKEE